MSSFALCRLELGPHTLKGGVRSASAAPIPIPSWAPHSMGQEGGTKRGHVSLHLSGHFWRLLLGGLLQLYWLMGSWYPEGCIQTLNHLQARVWALRDSDNSAISLFCSHLLYHSLAWVPVSGLISFTPSLFSHARTNPIPSLLGVCAWRTPHWAGTDQMAQAQLSLRDVHWPTGDSTFLTTPWECRLPHSHPLACSPSDVSQMSPSANLLLKPVSSWGRQVSLSFLCLWPFSISLHHPSCLHVSGTVSSLKTTLFPSQFYYKGAGWWLVTAGLTLCGFLWTCVLMAVSRVWGFLMPLF